MTLRYPLCLIYGGIKMNSTNQVMSYLVSLKEKKIKFLSEVRNFGISI